MRVVSRRVPAGETDPELTWLAVSIAAFIAGALWLKLHLPWPRCPFLALTGFPCLTCGATRATIAFSQGNSLTAWQWNPLAFFALCAIAVFDLYALVVVARRAARLRIVDWSATEKNAVRIAVVFLVALNW
ncbi:MAG TPA: DUF2752 domain-containing protein, partial [Chthoniobacterales bacterium]